MCSFWPHLLSTFKGHFRATLLAAISFMTEDFDILLELVCWYVDILMPDTLKVHYVGFWGDLWAEMESIYSIIFLWNVCIRAVTTNHEENELIISTKGKRGQIYSATMLHRYSNPQQYPARTWRPSYALIHPQKAKGKRGAFKGWNPTATPGLNSLCSFVQNESLVHISHVSGDDFWSSELDVGIYWDNNVRRTQCGTLTSSLLTTWCTGLLDFLSDC